MGFLSLVGVLNKWLTEEESLWLQSRVYVRAHHYYHSWMHFFRLFVRTSLLAIFSSAKTTLRYARR